MDQHQGRWRWPHANAAAEPIPSPAWQGLSANYSNAELLDLATRDGAAKHSSCVEWLGGDGC